MKLSFPALGALALLALVSLPVPAHAQAPAVAVRPAPHQGIFSYDPTKEVTLSGTVSSVLKKPNPGMIMGSHLMVATSTGAVDASLGRLAFLGKDAISVDAGQQVQITGVMKSVNDKQFFLVRTLQVGGHTYNIRNEHGVGYGRPGRDSSSAKAPKGDRI
jgi:hypothetical protein